MLKIVVVAVEVSGANDRCESNAKPSQPTNIDIYRTSYNGSLELVSETRELLQWGALRRVVHLAPKS